MNGELASRWKETFFRLLESDPRASQLKEASLEEDLGKWTILLTDLVTDNCRALGWSPAAIGHTCRTIPVSKSEYLKIDVMAFSDSITKWQFPIAVFELENKRDPNYISYALWKLLCVRAPLRVLFCYRPTPKEGSDLVSLLNREVIQPIPIEERVKVDGSLILCVGNRHHAGTFPYDFFRWWEFDKHTGNFTRM
ncbi:MAG: hypothetical protein GX465_15830 [Acidobacteria bacterium]|nr:hypothetical protein [Acidobacteriota bacterium]